jgi:hypothetical protein
MRRRGLDEARAATIGIAGPLRTGEGARVNDRQKRVAAGLVLLLLGLGAFFLSRRGPTAAPVVATAAAPSATTPVEVASAPVEAAPTPSAEPSASAADEAPTNADEPRDRATSGAAPTRRAAISKIAEAPAPAAAKSAQAAAPPAVSAAPTAGAAPIYPALVGQFMNRVGPQYRLLHLTCLLDGQTVYSGGGGAVQEIFRKMPPPGEHTVSIVAEYQGNGGGVFSYFDGYKFSVKSGRTFASKADAPTQITIAAVERGGPTTPFQERLALMVNVR